MGASVTSRYCWSKQCRFRRTEAWIAISPTWNETNLVFSKVTSLQRRIPIYIDCAPEPPQIMRHSVLLPANMMSMWPAAGFNSNLSKPIKTVCWFLVWRLFWPSSPPGAAGFLPLPSCSRIHGPGIKGYAGSECWSAQSARNIAKLSPRSIPLFTKPQNLFLWNLNV